MIFGHQTNSTVLGTDSSTVSATDQTAPAVANLQSDSSVTPPASVAAQSSDPATTDSALFDNNLATPLLDNPLADETTTNEVISPQTVAPQEEAPQPTTETTTEVSDDLLELKQQALGQLTPLVDHLEQNPEEKFRTTMMMIQSTDNQALIKEAFVAAQAITDDKARAQALLDVINEINYFTQQSGNK